MADVFSPAKRSEIMAKVKSRENRATELRLIQVFRDFEIQGWRRRARVFGKPDFVFSAVRLAVFVDGCFWHGCPSHHRLPSSNRSFWMRKLERNKERDRLVCRELKKMGWSVLRIWQHELRKPKLVVGKVRRSLARSAIRIEGANEVCRRSA